MTKSLHVAVLAIIVSVLANVASAADSVSCGSRSTYFILKYMGVEPEHIDDVKRIIKESADGTSSFAGIQQGLQSRGVSADGRKLSAKEISELPFPSIVSLKSDDGPHFSIFVRQVPETGDIVLLDPPQTVTLPKDEFFRQWTGFALVVKSRKAIIDPNPNNVGDLICPNDNQKLGSFILPVTVNPTVDFLVRNVSHQDLTITKVIPSCGCTTVTFDKRALKPNEETHVHAEVSLTGTSSGSHDYNIDLLPSTQDKPLRLQFSLDAIEAVVLRPRQIYFGECPQSKLPVRRSADVLGVISNGKAVQIIRVTTSQTWILAQIRGMSVEVTVAADAPLGEFSEIVTVETTAGKCQLPVCGECVGKFRVLPVPLLVQRDKAGIFEILGIEDSFDPDKIELHYDHAKLEISRSAESGSALSRNRLYSVKVLSDDAGVTVTTLHISYGKEESKTMSVLGCPYIADSLKRK